MPCPGKGSRRGPPGPATYTSHCLGAQGKVCFLFLLFSFFSFSAIKMVWTQKCCVRECTSWLKSVWTGFSLR